jgi:hypothetical protein
MSDQTETPQDPWATVKRFQCTHRITFPKGKAKYNDAYDADAVDTARAADAAQIAVLEIIVNGTSAALEAEKNAHTVTRKDRDDAEHAVSHYENAIVTLERERDALQAGAATVTWSDADAVIAALVAERDAAHQEIQTLGEGLTWALDALEPMLLGSPTPPLPSEAPMTETPTETIVERAALVAYYDVRHVQAQQRAANAQIEADAMAVLGRTVRVLTDAQVLDEHQRLVLRNR